MNNAPNNITKRLGRYFIVALVAVIVSVTSTAFAALTFTGSNIAGSASGVVIDSSSTISIGTSTASAVLIGRSGATVGFPGAVSTTNLAITALGTSGSNCLTVNAAGTVATTTCGTGSADNVADKTVCSATTSMKCDYTATGANDDVQIQEAINGLPSTGGHVILSDGQFNLGNEILLPSNVWLQGSGVSSTVLYMSNGTNKNVIHVDGTSTTPITNVHVSDLAINGNEPGNDSASPSYPPLNQVDKNWNGIRLDWTNYSTFNDLLIYDNSANGIHVENSSYNHFYDIDSRSNYFDGIFLVNQSYHNIVLESTLEDNEDAGISLEELAYPGEPAPPTGANDNVIEDNVFVGNGNALLGYCPIYGGPCDYALGTHASNDEVFSGNMITGNNFQGIWFDASSQGETVTGNTIVSNSGEGIQDLGTGNMLSDNVVESNGTANINLSSASSLSAGNLTGSSSNAFAIENNFGGGGVVSVQNINSTGYSATDYYNASGTLMGGMQFANSSAVATPGLFSVFGTEGLNLSSAGSSIQATLQGSNFGIGVGSAAPSTTLEIVGNYTDRDLVRIQNTAAAGYDSIGFFNNNATQEGGIGFANSSAAANFAGRVYFYSSGGDLVWSKDTGSTISMIIQGSTGNVGIGTTAPSTTLQVAGGSTIRIGAGTIPGCLELMDSSGNGTINYITASGGVLSATTTKPSSCQ